MKNPAAEERIAFSGGDSSWHPLRSGKCIFQVFLRGIEKVNMCSDSNNSNNNTNEHNAGGGGANLS